MPSCLEENVPIIEAAYVMRRRSARCLPAAMVLLAVLAIAVGGNARAHEISQGDRVPATELAAPEMPAPAKTVDEWPARTNSPTSPPAGDLSIAVLLGRADRVVQAVMGLLALASIACWTIFLTKLFELWHVRRRLSGGLEGLLHLRLLGDCVGPEIAAGAIGRSHVLVRLIDAATTERELSVGLIADGSTIDRYALRASEIVREEARRVSAGASLLATIGATAPFIGLFGTVWGIMNSFVGIARAQTTNLAVVAPGIAEALLATAMGLVAAIPAVIFYNFIARSTKAYGELASEGSGAVVRLLSRELSQPAQRFPARAAE